MLNTFIDLQSELLSRLNASTNSTFYSTQRIKDAINQAYIWAASEFEWPQTQKGRKTVTVANQDYYDYPTDFKTASIYHLTLATNPYKRKFFKDFLNYRYNNPTDQSNPMFANSGRQVFIFPTPTTNGDPLNPNLLIWGHFEVAEMTASGDPTVFSSSEKLVNEVIVRRALGIMEAKGRDSASGPMDEATAKAALAEVYGKIKGRMAQDQSVDNPMFDVPDYYGKLNNPIASFNYKPIG